MNPKAAKTWTDMPSFLSAHWGRVLLISYEVDPAILEPRVPAGTEPALHEGSCFVSIVGLRFLDMKILGVGIPFHRDFPQVNLRFHVRRLADGVERRGVVFVKEIVPKPAFALAARLTFNESYVTLPMWRDDHGSDVAYGWTDRGLRQRLGITPEGSAFLPTEGSKEHFLVENHWGFSRQRDGSTLEYRVDHPPWRVRRGSGFILECDVGSLYGEEFVPFLRRPPASMLLAEGSEVTVRPPHRIVRPDSALG